MAFPLLRHGRSSSRLKQSRFLITQFLNFSATPHYGGSASPESEPRPGPPPIRVAVTESAGRGIFATRKIGANEFIHTAKPFISHPTFSNIHFVCYFCLRRLKQSTEELQAQCQRFCSDLCREQAKTFYEVESKVDWSAYHDYCRNNALKYPLLVKRLACMVMSGSAPTDCLEILQPASLSPEATSKDWYVGILSRIRINAFRIELIGGSFEDLLSMAAAAIEAESAVGNAVYILPSFYNHDCDPNAHIVWIDNVDAKLVALRDVEEGEELRICYIDASMGRNARQTILSKGFGFNCNCLRCLSGE
ncbi:hypothetical protein V2J09_018970 [Rumex salicifolius]